MNRTYPTTDDADQTFEIDEDALLSEDSEISSAYESLSDTPAETAPEEVAEKKQSKRRKRKSKKSSKSKTIVIEEVDVIPMSGQDLVAMSSGFESVSGSVTAASGFSEQETLSIHDTDVDEDVQPQRPSPPRPPPPPPSSDKG